MRNVLVGIWYRSLEMVDDETKMKFQSLFTEVDYNLFKRKGKWSWMSMEIVCC